MAENAGPAFTGRVLAIVLASKGDLWLIRLLAGGLASDASLTTRCSNLVPENEKEKNRN